MKVIGIKYEICKPHGPRLVCLKLAFIDLDSGRTTGAGFSIKYELLADLLTYQSIGRCLEGSVPGRSVISVNCS